MKLMMEFPDSHGSLEEAKAMMSQGLVARATKVVAIDENGERKVLKDRRGHDNKRDTGDFTELDRQCRTLHLQRDIDSTGVSGVGIVAYGVEFPDGTIVLRWDTKVRSTVFYNCYADLETITGHGGNTKIIYHS